MKNKKLFDERNFNKKKNDDKSHLVEYSIFLFWNDYFMCHFALVIKLKFEIHWLNVKIILSMVF
jgi:hypothetical protein